MKSIKEYTYEQIAEHCVGIPINGWIIDDSLMNGKLKVHSLTIGGPGIIDYDYFKYDLLNKAKCEEILHNKFNNQNITPGGKSRLEIIFGDNET